MTMFVQRDSGQHKADVGCVAQPRTRFGSGGKNKRPSESATSAQPKPVLRFFRRPLYVFGIPFIAQTQRPIKKFDKQSLPKSVSPCIIRAHTDSKTRSRLLSPQSLGASRLSRCGKPFVFVYSLCICALLPEGVFLPAGTVPDVPPLFSDGLLNPFMRKAKITRLPIAAKQGKMASLRFFTFPKPIRRQP